ncbi:MAG: ArsR family transcriptional regulator, partial [Euryarchaeota archaeon]|nr:ArsR family transcriptional regulator [Euryarchaeota archaeon]
AMFKTLSSETRREMLRLLAKEEMHISGLAKELGISVPVTARHAKILEESGLLERKKFGKTHVLKANLNKIYEALDAFSESFELRLPKGSSILDALKEVSGVKVERIGDREFVTSIDGEEGYYIYEVNGSTPNVSMNKFLLNKNSKIELKKLVPIKRKEMRIKIKSS